MNSRKTSISHVMNDSSTDSNVSDRHQQQSASGVCSLKNILSDDGPSSHVHTQQHASSSQHSQPPPPPQYNQSSGNSGSGGNSIGGGYGGSYSNEQQTRDYYYPSRSHQYQPPLSQPEAEATTILLSLSNPNQNTTQSSPVNSHYRDHYPPKDNEQQMSDVEAATTISSLSSISNNSNNNHNNNHNHNNIIKPQIDQRPRAKSNSMSIESLMCGDESTSSESGHSISSRSSMDTSQQKYQHNHHDTYPEDIRNGDINANNNQIQNQPIIDYNNGPYNPRKYPHAKRPPPSSGPIPLVVTTNSIPKMSNSKMIQKRGSPQKRRPSDSNEFTRPKLHNQSSQFSQLSTNVPKLTDVREQLGEERNANRITPIAPMAPVTHITPVTPIAPISAPMPIAPQIPQIASANTNHMDWNRAQHSQHPQHSQHSQHSQSYRSSHNVQPSQPDISNNRYMNNNHSMPIQKSGGSPSFNGDQQKLNYQSIKAPSPPTGPPVNVPNGYSHGHGAGVGGMIGTHTDVPPQPSQQPPPTMLQQQHQMPPLRGQNSAFSKKYYHMKHDPKMKRNAPHAYISYMIYTNENVKPKDGPLQSQPPQNISSRQVIPNGSPPLNNDHGMMISHHQPQINGNMYNSREPQHPGYPPIQPNTGYIHSSESVNSGVPPRRVSEPSMHSHLNANTGSRNGSHGYPSTHINGPPPPVDEHQPLPPQSHTSHRHSMSSPNLPNPNLLPPNTTAPTQKHSLPNILPANQHPSQRHVSLSNGLTTTLPSTSRPSTSLPPIQSAPQPHHHHHVSNSHNTHTHHHHHYPSDQTHAHLGHSHTHYHPVSQPSQPPPVYMPAHHQYGKSASPQIQPQSPPIMNPSRQPPQGPSVSHYHQPQSGSNRISGISTPHHHHPHHHQAPSEPVGPPINSNPTNNILREPLTRFLDPQSQPSGYGGSVHHPLSNGVPGGHIPVQQRAYNY